MENEVFLDNLPRTANQILNVLWDKNRAMTMAEITEAVSTEYNRTIAKSEIQKFVKMLIYREYIERKIHGFHAYYQTLGMDDFAEEM